VERELQLLHVMSKISITPIALTINLPPVTTCDALALACREAWTTFIEESRDWGKNELAAWSTAMYVPILRSSTGRNQSVIPPGTESDADPRFAQRLIRAARASVVGTLCSFAVPAAREAFADAMLTAPFVAHTSDCARNDGFAPVAVRGRLSDLVLSLVAADMLTFPDDFEREVMCDDCGKVRLAPEPCCFREALTSGTFAIATRRAS
jgi:hypothetical protein